MKRLNIKEFHQLCETLINKNIIKDLLLQLVDNPTDLSYGKGINVKIETFYLGTLERQHVMILNREKCIFDLFTNRLAFKDDLKSRLTTIENDIDHLTHQLTKRLDLINTFNTFQITGLLRRCSGKSFTLTYRDSVLGFILKNPVTHQTLFQFQY